jgi:hypothetical protein
MPADECIEGERYTRRCLFICRQGAIKLYVLPHAPGHMLWQSIWGEAGQDGDPDGSLPASIAVARSFTGSSPVPKVSSGHCIRGVASPVSCLFPSVISVILVTGVDGPQRPVFNRDAVSRHTRDRPRSVITPRSDNAGRTYLPPAGTVSHSCRHAADTVCVRRNRHRVDYALSMV